MKEKVKEEDKRMKENQGDQGRKWKNGKRQSENATEWKKGETEGEGERE